MNRRRRSRRFHDMPRRRLRQPRVERLRLTPALMRLPQRRQDQQGRKVKRSRHDQREPDRAVSIFEARDLKRRHRASHVPLRG